MVQIRIAEGPADYAPARELFEEYQAEIGIPLCFQNFQHELDTLPGAYAAPRGRLLLAFQGGLPAGCVAIRLLDAHTCEMKRLYVRPALRGVGIGRALVERAIAEARRAGYERMRLDTLESMRAARALYTSLGFVEIAPYNEQRTAGTHWMELRLSAPQAQPPHAC